MNSPQEGVRYWMTTMPEGTQIPSEVHMPFSTVMTYRHVIRHPSPEDMSLRTLPALRAFHEAARQTTRSSINALTLLPYSNIENTIGPTKAILIWLKPDRNTLPLTSRLRRVMGKDVPYAVDGDYLSEGVDAEGFVRDTRPRIREAILDHYLGYAGGARLMDRRIASQVAGVLGLVRRDGDVTRFRSKYFLTADESVESREMCFSKTRWLEMEIDEGFRGGRVDKPYMDVAFFSVDRLLGRTGRQHLVSLTTAPHYSGEALRHNKRTAPWVINWDTAYGQLVPIEDLDTQKQQALQEANRLASIRASQGYPHPERRTAVDGVFAQSLHTWWDAFPYQRRIRQDFCVRVPERAIHVLTGSMHCDSSILEEPASIIFEQAKRAARKNDYFAANARHSQRGREDLDRSGVAIDGPTLELFRGHPTPQALRAELRKLPSADRERILDEHMAEDWVELNNPFHFPGTYRTLNLFRFYRHLKKISDREWDRIHEDLVGQLGTPGLFAKKMYILNHPTEIGYTTQDGGRSPFDLWAVGKIYEQYKNPLQAFVRAIRNARVRSTTIRRITDLPYLEAIDRLLTLDV